jgi:hypothetical protein
MSLLALLVNLLVMLVVLAVVFYIARLILDALGLGRLVNIALAIVLLVGLIWFLNMVGLVGTGGSIVQIR